MTYKAEYSIARKIESKLIGCISLLDDTYDSYDTVEEIELFTQAIQRFISNQIIWSTNFISCYTTMEKLMIWKSFTLMNL